MTRVWFCHCCREYGNLSFEEARLGGDIRPAVHRAGVYYWGKVGMAERPDWERVILCRNCRESLEPVEQGDTR